MRKDVPVAQLLELYTFEELLEMSDLDEEDVLLILDNAGVLKRPEVSPL
jgi:hypothetical protein